MSRNISAAAEVRREAARGHGVAQPGQFGTQQHSAPDGAFGTAQVSPHPQWVIVHGQRVYLGRVEDEEALQSWPKVFSAPDIAWEHADGGGVRVSIGWNDADGAAQQVWLQAGPGEYDETVTSFDVGDGSALRLTEEQREQVTEYGEAVLRRAQEVVGSFEYVSVAADDRTRDRITRLIDPTPFTDEERLRNEADCNVQQVSEQAGLPDVIPGVVQVLRDRGELTDAQAAELDSSDLTDLYERFIGPAIDRWSDDRNSGRPRR